MAIKIEPYEQRVLGVPVPDAPQLRQPPMAFNAGTAMGEMADDLKRGLTAYIHSEKQSAETTSLEAAARTRLSLEEQYIKNQESAKPGGQDFTSDYMKTFDAAVDKETAALPNTYAQEAYKKRMLSYKVESQERALRWEAERRREQRVDNVKAAADANATSVFTAPAAEREQRAVAARTEMDETVDRLLLPPDVKDSLRDYYRKRLATAGYQADAADRPEFVHNWAMAGTSVVGGEIVPAPEAPAAPTPAGAPTNPDTPTGVKTMRVDPNTGAIEGQPEAKPEPPKTTAPRGPVADHPVNDGAGDAYYRLLRQTESGGNDNDKAKTSSAFGRYQFTRGAWLDTIRAHPELKLTESDRMSPAAQELAIRARTADNARLLKEGGFAPTNVNLYMQHFLGPAGGVRFLKGLKGDPNGDPRKYVDAKSIEANPGVFRPGRTMQDIYLRFGTKMGGSGEGGTGAAVTYDKKEPVPAYYRDLTVEQRQDAINRSRVELSRRRTEGHVAFKQTVDNALVQTQTNGSATVMPTEDHFVSAYGVNDGGLKYQEFKVNVGAAKASFELQRMPAAEIPAYVEALKPEAGDPVFADKMTAYTRVKEVAAKLTTARQTDSAAYVLETSKDTKAAYDAISNATDEKGAAEAAIKYAGFMDAEQQRLGIPANARRLLPATVSGDIAATLQRKLTSGTQGEAIVSGLNTLKERWGDLWPRVRNEMKDSLSAPLQVITSGVNPRVAATLLAVHDESVEKIAAPLAAGTVKTITDSTRENFQPFLDSTSWNVQGQEAAMVFYEQGRKLAAVYARQGMDAEAAAKQAYKDLIEDKYDFIEGSVTAGWFGGGVKSTLRVPKGMSEGVSEGLGVMFDEIVNAPTRAIGKNIAPYDIERADEATKAYLRREARWYTLPDNSGVGLLVNGGQWVDSKGARVKRTWEQIRAAGARTVDETETMGE